MDKVWYIHTVEMRAMRTTAEESNMGEHHKDTSELYQADIKKYILDDVFI